MFVFLDDVSDRFRESSGRPSSAGATLLSERYDALGAEADRRWRPPGSDPL